MAMGNGTGEKPYIWSAECERRNCRVFNVALMIKYKPTKARLGPDVAVL
jgi:hypothetical protein